MMDILAIANNQQLRDIDGVIAILEGNLRELKDRRKQIVHDLQRADFSRMMSIPKYRLEFNDAIRCSSEMERLVYERSGVGYFEEEETLYIADYNPQDDTFTIYNEEFFGLSPKHGIGGIPAVLVLEMRQAYLSE